MPGSIWIWITLCILFLVWAGSPWIRDDPNE